MSSILPADAVLMLAFSAGIAVLALIARLHPLVSATLGTILVGIAVAQVAFFQRSSFQSEGSAAGLLFFIAYAGLGVLCATLGAIFLWQGAFQLARGTGRRVLPPAAAVVVSVLLVAAAVTVPVWMVRQRAAAQVALEPRAGKPAGQETAVRRPSAGLSGNPAQDAARCEVLVAETRDAYANRTAAPDAALVFQEVCGGVVRNAGALRQSSPREAAEPMLRAFEAMLDLGTGLREYAGDLDALVAALARVAPESREAIWAHAVKAQHLARTLGAEQAAVVRAPLEFAMPLAPRVLAPDDRAYEAVYRAASIAVARDPALVVPLLELAKSREAAAGAGTDLAVRMQHDACAVRQGANHERETLGACAARSMVAWRQRAVAGKSFDVFGSEPDLAMGIARMHRSSAWATNDFTAGLAGVREVQAMVATRFPAGKERDALDPALRQIEGELAAKAGAR